MVETHCGHSVEAHGRHQSCPYTSYTQQNPVLPLQFPNREIRDDEEEMLKDRGTNQDQRKFYLHIKVLQNIRQEGCSSCVVGVVLTTRGPGAGCKETL